MCGLVFVECSLDGAQLIVDVVSRFVNAFSKVMSVIVIMTFAGETLGTTDREFVEIPKSQ